MDRRVLMTLAGSMLTLPAAAQDLSGPRGLPDRFAETLNTRDIKSFGALFAEDYVEHEKSVAMQPPTGKTPKQAIVAFYAERMAGIPDLQVAVETIVVSSSRVAASFIYTGTHGGLLFGLPPTGRRLRFSSCDIFRLENGLIAEHWGMRDIAGLLMQVQA